MYNWRDICSIKDSVKTHKIRAYMSQEIVIKLRHKAEEANLSIVSLIDEVERKLSNPRDAIPLGDFQKLSALMKKKSIRDNFGRLRASN